MLCPWLKLHPDPTVSFYYSFSLLSPANKETPATVSDLPVKAGEEVHRIIWVPSRGCLLYRPVFMSKDTDTGPRDRIR